MKLLPIGRLAGEARSREEAAKRGCGGGTSMWWSVIDEGIIIYSDDAMDGFTEEEIAAVTEYSFPEEP